MSSFLVSNATIDACIHAIHTYDESDKTLFGYSDSDALGAALLRLNEAALGEGTAPSDHKDYRYTHREISGIKAYKSLDCLTYQCSEDALLHAPLFLRLKAFRDRMAVLMIRGTKEYKDAQWNITSPITGWESV